MNNLNNNIVVIGAGPIGIITACTMKAMNNNLNITVVDKRPFPQRNHGLNIGNDSISEILKELNETLKNNSTSINKELIGDLKQKLVSWKRGFVRTSTIEREMAEIALKHNIIVERNKEFEITANPKTNEDKFEVITFDELLSPEVRILTESQSRLRTIFQNASYLIAADGAHSEIRKAITGEKKDGVLVDKVVDKKIMQYVIELKYQTNGKAKARNTKAALKEISRGGDLQFESVSSNQSAEEKPVTLHIFVDKETYKKLRREEVVEDKVKTKGVFGNSWTLPEIEKLSEDDLEIKRIYETFQKHIETHKKNGGKCEDEKISTLDLTVFRSNESVKKIKGKHVILVGDANSGMVLERGVNKGIKEAALCARAVCNAIESDDEYKVAVSLLNYQNQTRQIFKEEKRFAEFKNFWVIIAQKIVFFIAKIISLVTRSNMILKKNIWKKDIKAE